MEERSVSLGRMQKELSRMEGGQRSLTNLVILLFSFGMLFLMLSLYERGAVSFEAVVICTVAQMGSFGPVVALSSLSNNLNQTDVYKRQAHALGMTKRQAYFRIIIPQAIIVALPNYFNFFLALLKGTSVVFTISVVDRCV